MIGMVGQTAGLDEKSAELFKQLAEGLLTIDAMSDDGV